MSPVVYENFKVRLFSCSLFYATSARRAREMITNIIVLSSPRAIHNRLREFIGVMSDEGAAVGEGVAFGFFWDAVF